MRFFLDVSVRILYDIVIFTKDQNQCGGRKFGHCVYNAPFAPGFAAAAREPARASPCPRLHGEHSRWRLTSTVALCAGPPLRFPSLVEENFRIHTIEVQKF